MDARGVVRAISAGRLALGAGMLALPGPLGAVWIGDGAHDPATTVMTRAFAAREAFLGFATLLLVDSSVAPAIVAAGALCDGADLVGTLAARESLSRPAVLAVGGAAAGALLGGLACAGTLRRS